MAKGSKATKSGKTTSESEKERAPASDRRAELAELAKMGSARLQKRYQEVLGRRATTCNVMQLRGEIGRALLALDGAIATDTRSASPSPAPPPPPPRDWRLPAAGSILRREHDGVVHRVKVLEHGFVYQGAQYRTLSAVAKAITGTIWNGFLWFGLCERAPKQKGGSAA